MSDQGFRRPPPEKNALDNNKLQLSTPCPTPAGKGKYSTLKVEFVKNNPRFVVWTNDPEDTGERNNYGKIVAALDLPTMFMLFGLVEDVIAGPAGGEPIQLQNLNFKYPGGKRTDRPVLESKVFVGKDADGVVFISVIAYEEHRPKIVFPFLPTQYHNLVHRDGTAWEKGKLSEKFARGFLAALKPVINHLSVIKYVPPEPKNNQGGGGGGNNYGNRGGGGGGGYQQQQGGGNQGGGGGGGGNPDTSSYADDLPF